MPRSQSAVLAIALQVVAAFSVAASRREYRVTLDGQRKSGSEACFYRGVQDHTPFGLYFAGTKVTCLSADQVLDFPSGLFHAFARHPEGYASSWRDYFVYSTAVPEAGYEVFETPLEPAGWLDFSSVLPLKAGQTAGVWVGPSATTTSFFIPLAERESTILVPAGRTCVPLIVGNRRPVRIGTPITVTAGIQAAASFIVARDGTADVMLWLRLEDPAHAVTETYPPPEITLEGGGVRYQPVGGQPKPRDGTYTLLFFRGVPRGPLTLDVRGKLWTAYQAPMTASTPVSTVEDPVVIAPGGAVRATWGDRAAEAHENPPGCGAVARTPLVRARLLHCSRSGEECTPVADANQPLSQSGSMTFDGLPAGDYRLAVIFPSLKPQTFPVSIKEGKETGVPLSFDGFAFFGRLSINGVPAAGNLTFSTGVAQANANGAYAAFLGGDPLQNQVSVNTCDGRRFTYVPASPPLPNSPFDIDIQVAPVVVSVTNASGEAVTGARVRWSSVKKKNADGTHTVFYTSGEVTTDPKGQADFDTVDLTHDVIFCAEGTNYPRTCSEPIASERLERDRKASLRLADAAARGRIAGHAGHALLAFVDAQGSVTEQIADISPDGAFTMQKAHAIDEYCVYTSDRRPLAVMRLPAEWHRPDVLELTLPDVPSRSIEVAIAGGRKVSGYVGLWVGNAYIPLDVLARHAESRGVDSTIEDGQPAHLPDIAATAPLFVAFSEPEPASPAFVDVFTRPQSAGIRRIAVTADRVVIPPR